MHILAVFILVYVGVEVTIGGWIVSYVIDERGGGPDSGYISSGFFAGELGRVVCALGRVKVPQRRTDGWNRVDAGPVSAVVGECEGEFDRLNVDCHT